MCQNRLDLGFLQVGVLGIIYTLLAFCDPVGAQNFIQPPTDFCESTGKTSSTAAANAKKTPETGGTEASVIANTKIMPRLTGTVVAPNLRIALFQTGLGTIEMVESDRVGECYITRIQAGMVTLQSGVSMEKSAILYVETEDYRFKLPKASAKISPYVIGW